MNPPTNNNKKDLEDMKKILKNGQSELDKIKKKVKTERDRKKQIEHGKIRFTKKITKYHNKFQSTHTALRKLKKSLVYVKEYTEKKQMPINPEELTKMLIEINLFSKKTTLDTCIELIEENIRVYDEFNTCLKTIEKQIVENEKNTDNLEISVRDFMEEMTDNLSIYINTENSKDHVPFQHRNLMTSNEEVVIEMFNKKKTRYSKTNPALLLSMFDYAIRSNSNSHMLTKERRRSGTSKKKPKEN